MARNRKSQTAARFGPALRALLLCLLIGGSGVGYVWQKEQISKLGESRKKKELYLKALTDENEILRRQLANMRGPQFLESQIRKSNLGLVKPQDSQIWRLPEPTAEALRPPSLGTQYAAGNMRPLVAQ